MGPLPAGRKNYVALSLNKPKLDNQNVILPIIVIRRLECVAK